MKLLPSNLVISKNLLSNPDPWLLLFAIDIPSDPEFILRIVNNTEDIVFEGNTYSAFPVSVELLKQQNTGEIPVLTARLGNVTRAVQQYLEDYDGLVGQPVTMYCVNSAYLTEDYSSLTWSFTVTACKADAQWIDFGLGLPNPLRRRFPLYRYMPDYCSWIFKGAECKYAGTDSFCKKILGDCQGRTEGSNSLNFGGHIGLRQGGIRIV